MPARYCFCLAHSALSTSDPSGSIEFLERRSDALMRYRFGQRLGRFRGYGDPVITLRTRRAWRAHARPAAVAAQNKRPLQSGANGEP